MRGNRHFDNYLRILILFALLYPRLGPASPLSEIIEVRMAKAEILLLDKREREALALIKQNVRSKYLHVESYFLLSSYYLERGKKSKGIKVLKALIKRAHKNKSKKPGVNALRAYFQLAQTYYNIGEEYTEKKKRDKKRKYSAYKKSKKYFELCQSFEFNLPYSKYYLGLIETKFKNNREAVLYLLDAREELLDSGDDEEMVENIDYLIGTTLIQNGRLNSGVLFLKNIINNQSASPSLKEYANIYLDELSSGNYFSLGLSAGIEFNDNVHFLNDSQREKFDTTFKSILFKEEVLYRSLGTNFYYSSPNRRGLSFLFLGGYNNLTATDENLASKDISTYSAVSYLTWNSFKKSILRLELSYYHTMYRPSNSSELKKFSGLYNIAPEWTIAGKQGRFQIKIPLARTNSVGEGETFDKGISFSYIPYFGKWYFNPSYIFTYTLAGEEKPNEDTHSKLLSISNHVAPSQTFSFFQNIKYTFYDNDNATLGFKELSFSLGISKTFRSLQGLSININVEKTQQTIDTGNKIKNLSGDAGLTYYF